MFLRVPKILLQLLECDFFTLIGCLPMNSTLELGYNQKSEVSSLDFIKKAENGATIAWKGILRPSYSPPTSPSQSRKL